MPASISCAVGKAACHPSARATIRRRAGFACPPIQMGMSPRVGLGKQPMASKLKNRPWKLVRSSRQHARMIRIASSDQAPRSSKGAPRISISSRIQPTPAPRMTRPRER